MAIASRHEIQWVGALLLALVAVLAVSKVEAAMRCDNLADCDEGPILKSWLGADCEGNVSYTVLRRANESIGCIPVPRYDQLFYRFSCDSSSASKEYVQRVYKDSGCKTEVGTEKLRLESCVNRQASSGAYFCSKSDAATKAVRPATSTPPIEGFPRVSFDHVTCNSNDAACMSGETYYAWSFWDKKSCEPKSAPNATSRGTTEFGVCYVNSQNTSFSKTICSGDWIVSKDYSNGCDENSWYTSYATRSGVCFSDSPNTASIYYCAAPPSSTPPPKSDSARNLNSLLFSLVLVAMFFLGV